MTPTYKTLSAALKARAWVRSFTKRKRRAPTVEERAGYITKMFTKEIDVAYVYRACEDMPTNGGTP